MKLVKKFGYAAAILASSIIAVPQTIQAAETQIIRAQGKVVDIALHQGGLLVGQVVDASGKSQEGQQVAVIRGNEVVAKGVTAKDGQFQIAGLQGGTYQVQSNIGSTSCRFWAPQTAPPSAAKGLLMVNSEELARGQGEGVLCFLSNPWVLGALVAAAIAIPLALDDDDAS
jgi:hypothetical protein